jgi:translation initiation factor IF-2
MKATFEIIPNYIFSKSNPAIFAINIIEGTISVGDTFNYMTFGIMKRNAGKIAEIQQRGINVKEVSKGEEAIIKVNNFTVSDDRAMTYYIK